MFTGEVISNQAQLAHFLPVLRGAPWVALDTEADSLHAYPEKLCLVQISLPGLDKLIDPLASFDLAPLMQNLQSHELLIHAADYDLRLLKRCLDFVPSAVFDTMLAARFLGQTEFGLTHLVSRYLGVTLSKGAQTANWSRRPLPERLLIYARNDTHYLKPLADQLRLELRQTQRLDWHRQSCERLIADCRQPRQTDPNLAWRISGSDRLSRPALAVLRALWNWREEEAIRHNRPPYFVVSHELLIALAVATTGGHRIEPLLPPHLSPRRRLELARVSAEGLTIPPPLQPEPLRHRSRRFTEAEHRRFDELKKRRDRRAHELGMDPTFIASRAALMALAKDEAESDLLAWQRDLLLS